MESPPVPRALSRRALDALADTPVLVVNGPRQSGKTTLVRNLDYPGPVEHVTLDDPIQQDAARLDPRSFVRRTPGCLVIDEAQLVPELFRAVKAAVDEDRRPGRFVLTGSTRLLAAPDMAASLVGRVELLDLWPFSQGELDGTEESFVDRIADGVEPFLRPFPDDPHALAERVLRGGFPEALARPPARRNRWFDTYATTTVQSVIRQLAAIEQLGEIPRIFRLLAARTSQELNVTAVARDLGLPARTVDGYLHLLAEAFVVQLLPGWAGNVSAKEVRRPKAVLSDSGLAARLVRATTAGHASFGALLETFVVNELRKQVGWSDAEPTLAHFRDRSGAEVDVVLEYPDGRVVGLEVKATRTPRGDDFRGLQFLADRLGPRFAAGVVLHSADEAVPFGPRMAALPVRALWATAASSGAGGRA